MTPQLAMAHVAGKSLDERVAEALARSDPNSREWLRLLDYSTRIEDAWVALSTIIPPNGIDWRNCPERRRHAVELKMYYADHRPYWQCEIRRLTYAGDPSSTVFFGSGDTAPMAICRVLLLLGSAWKMEDEAP